MIKLGNQVANTAIFFSLTAALIACNTSHAETRHGAFEWSYQGNTGPEKWGELKPEYATCKSGHNQSPVDLASAAVPAQLGNISFHYQESELDVINNGHTLQIDHNSDSYVTLDGVRYNLVQFHFHGPSEHIVDGNSHAMEAHLVHQSEDGALAVLGVLMDIGDDNPFISSIWDIQPNHGERKTVEHVKIDVSDILPSDKTYFKYSGSLTTPPCTEGVHWVVFSDTVTVSQEQVAHFKSMFELSARPVQPLHSRSVLFSGN